MWAISKWGDLIWEMLPWEFTITMNANITVISHKMIRQCRDMERGNLSHIIPTLLSSWGILVLYLLLHMSHAHVKLSRCQGMLLSLKMMCMMVRWGSLISIMASSCAHAHALAHAHPHMHTYMCPHMQEANNSAVALFPLLREGSPLWQRKWPQAIIVLLHSHTHMGVCMYAHASMCTCMHPSACAQTVDNRAVALSLGWEHIIDVWSKLQPINIMLTS